MGLKLSDFDFQLPQNLIAQEPVFPRDACKLMVLKKNEQIIEERIFSEIHNYFLPGDVLVLNNTRVFPARLFAKREGKPNEKPIEIFLLKKIGENFWEVLTKPSRKLKNGTKIFFQNNVFAEVREVLSGSKRLLRFPENFDVLKFAEKEGFVPLPPYIKNYSKNNDNLKKDYQTIYAQVLGATAAPTAGLHFTENLLDKIKKKGVKIVFLTLHTGYGTFSPIRVEKIEDHQMDAEFCEISKETAKIINEAKKNGKKIFAVGTTVTRALESAVKQNHEIKPFYGETSLFIYPGFNFKVIDGLVTNFHLPKSTLILLASAFAGADFLKKAYSLAIKKGYRFFSFGDAMLIF